METTSLCAQLARCARRTSTAYTWFIFPYKLNLSGRIVPYPVNINRGLIRGSGCRIQWLCVNGIHLIGSDNLPNLESDNGISTRKSDFDRANFPTIIPIFGWLDAITWAFTGRQNLEKFLLMHHVEPGPLAAEIDQLAQAIDLDDRLDDRAARYSQGMRVKLQVMAAMLLQRAYGHALLLLDEPFIGLDLFTQRYLRHLVGAELRRDNVAMLLATHQPEDIEALCDEVIVLDRGRVLAKDSVANLRRVVRKHESIHLRYAPTT
ncbi:MAG: hypothetical protein E6R03_13400, partial [Hyphomicrobiaceae bacterium]